MLTNKLKNKTKDNSIIPHHTSTEGITHNQDAKTFLGQKKKSKEGKYKEKHMMINNITDKMIMIY